MTRSLDALLDALDKLPRPVVLDSEGGVTVICTASIDAIRADIVVSHGPEDDVIMQDYYAGLSQEEKA